MTRKSKSIIIAVSLSIVAAILIGVLYSVFLPLSINETDIELKNIAVENIGNVFYGETLTEKEWRSDYFYNKSLYGMDWAEYEKIYCESSSFEAFSVSFDIVNNTDKVMGLFSVVGTEAEYIVVMDCLDNEESVYIDPGESCLVSFVVYVDCNEFTEVDEEFVLGKIEKIEYSPLNGTDNTSIFFGGDIVGLFYKRYFNVG